MVRFRGVGPWVTGQSCSSSQWGVFPKRDKTTHLVCENKVQPKNGKKERGFLSEVSFNNGIPIADFPESKMMFWQVLWRWKNRVKCLIMDQHLSLWLRLLKIVNYFEMCTNHFLSKSWFKPEDLPLSRNFILLLSCQNQGLFELRGFISLPPHPSHTNVMNLFWQQSKTVGSIKFLSFWFRERQLIFTSYMFGKSCYRERRRIPVTRIFMQDLCDTNEQSKCKAKQDQVIEKFIFCQWSMPCVKPKTWPKWLPKVQRWRFFKLWISVIGEFWRCQHPRQMRPKGLWAVFRALRPPAWCQVGPNSKTKWQGVT